MTYPWYDGHVIGPVCDKRNTKIRWAVYIYIIVYFILLQNETGSSGSLLGYRAMWRRLRMQYGLPVTRFVTLINTVSGSIAWMYL